MDNEREYYVACGEDLEKAVDFISRRQAASDAMISLARELGGKSSASNGWSMGGVIFEGEPPTGWILKGYTRENEPFYLPRKTTKEGRELAKRITDIRMPNMYDFHAMYDKNGGVDRGSAGYGKGQRVLYISWEYVGGCLLLSVPIGSTYKPNGSRKIKMSEYWAMKEALNEAA
jgi:hypothetical protein